MGELEEGTANKTNISTKNESKKSTAKKTNNKPKKGKVTIDTNVEITEGLLMNIIKSTNEEIKVTNNNSNHKVNKIIVGFDYGIGNGKSSGIYAGDDFKQENIKNVIFTTTLHEISHYKRDLYTQEIYTNLNNEIFTLDNEHFYIIGKSAIYKNDMFLKEEHQLQEPQLSLFLGTSLYKTAEQIESLKGVDSIDIELTVGLTRSDYNTQRESLYKLLLNKVIKIKNVNNNFISFNIVDVTISVQGVGTFDNDFFIFKNNKLEMNSALFLPSYRGYIEMGYKTTELILTFNGIIEPEYSRSIDVGLMSYYYNIAQNIDIHLIGEHLSPRIVDHLLNENNGIYESNGLIIDMKPFAEEERKKITGKINDEIKNLWSDLIPFTNLTFAGGGAEVILDNINFKKITKVIKDDCIFSNSDGYLKKALYLKEVDNSTI